MSKKRCRFWSSELFLGVVPQRHQLIERESGHILAARIHRLFHLAEARDEFFAGLRERGLGVDVMVGGAVVTPAFAESIGANYSSDAVDAVRLAKSLIAARKNQ